jgi:hypothetical protein
LPKQKSINNTKIKNLKLKPKKANKNGKKTPFVVTITIGPPQMS